MRLVLSGITGHPQDFFQRRFTGHDTRYAIITQQSCIDMQLAVGQRASALFKASSVIVGVTD